MNSKIRSLLFACMGLLFGMSVMYVYNNFIAEKKEQPKIEKSHQDSSKKIENNHSIDELTAEKRVIDYVKINHQLPDFYLTKNEAKKQGWNPSQGNLCEILPGKAIGGDHFNNREGKLPKAGKYFEADVNYNCGNRNADRIVFTKNGEVYLTKNHYKSFEKQ
ncbi:Ribonuclease [Chryseobacterium aquaeductus]|uniref:Ribonuclease n=1 Tax=Chryseobacterium aquaeductus TaxID=2675056 RepID=A0A9N8MEH8_9FLAO|nr:ribonuclease domain-containing protein [Chryseobacterium aquaeductus]CAA7329672.1 Ribonuclease [Chryseobacterium potabilaquae]CAD7798289.1 Ribonuclease [Chryseobacterium aquaeductus]